MGVLSQKTREQVFGIGAEEIRQDELLLDNVILDLGMILAAKWWVAGHEIVAKSTKGPPVDGSAISFAEDDFGSHVLYRAQDGVAAVFGFLHGHLGEAKIGEKQVPFGVQ
jgi:hypothetical protein